MRFLWPWYCRPLMSRFKYPLYRFLLIGLLFVVAIFIVGITIIGLQPLGQRSHTSLPIFTKPNPAFQKVSVAVATDVKDPSLRYGIVVDLGSSGSRVFVYFWPPHDGTTSELLNIQQMRDRDADPVVKKISPGISSLKDTPANASENLAPLLKYAAEHIPRKKHKETPLYVMATAGLRMLSTDEQEAILNSLRVDIPMKFDFLFAKTHAEVISGRQEGVYLWIAINHALGKFDHTLEDDDLDMVYLPNVRNTDQHMHVRKRSNGVIDMGGASLQIAYEVPDASEVLESQLTKFNLGCSNSDIQHTYSIYVTTFLGYGGNTARTRYEHMLIEQHLQSQNTTVTSNLLLDSTKNVIPDPCLTVNKVEHVTYGGKQFDLKGTGNYLLCQRNLVPLLNKSVICQKRPCSMNGVFQPEIKFQRATFFGFSEFYYSSEDVLRLGGVYHYETFEKAAKAHCATEWKTLEIWHRKNYYPKATHHRLKTECFKAAWMTTVLHEGFGFPRTYQRLTTTQLLYGREVQWTLGAILYKTRFYPLRYMKTETLQHGHTYQFSGLHQVTFVLLVSCFSVVLAAILGFIWHLHVGQRVSLRRVPTMSYFMTDPSQAEEGILVQDTNYYYP